MSDSTMSQQRIVNGVDVGELKRLAGRLQQDPSLARFEFRARNRWVEGGHSRTTVRDFDAVGGTIEHGEPFEIDADEPPVLLGRDEGANPVEHLLNSLVSCLTGAMVYHAALRGINIEELESRVEGDLDVRGFMGLADDVRKGYESIRVVFRVKADATEAELEECARFSPVFDVVSRGTDVALRIEKA